MPRIEEALSEYYRLCGWSEEGIPSKQKLEEIGLDKEAIKEFLDREEKRKKTES